MTGYRLMMFTLKRQQRNGIFTDKSLPKLSWNIYVINSLAHDNFVHRHNLTLTKVWHLNILQFINIIEMSYLLINHDTTQTQPPIISLITYPLGWCVVMFIVKSLVPAHIYESEFDLIITLNISEQDSKSTSIPLTSSGCAFLWIRNEMYTPHLQLPRWVKLYCSVIN